MYREIDFNETEENKIKRQIEESLTREILIKNIKNKSYNLNNVIVPKDLIFDTNINYKTKYLYIIMKKHSYKSKSSNNKKDNSIIHNELNIGYKKLMYLLDWNDKRAFKRHLEILKEKKYIEYDFTDVNITKPINLKLLNQKGIQFIMYPKDLLQLAINLNIELNYKTDKKYNHEKGLIYLYIQKHYYNESHGKGWSSPTVKHLQKILGISGQDLSKIIMIYHNNYLCEYHQGRRKFNNASNPMKRENNKYIINDINKDLVNKYHLRYIRHKKDDFFND